MKRASHAGADWTRATLDALTCALSARHGQDFARFDEAFVARSLVRRQEATSAPSPAAYVERVTHDAAEAEALLGSLDIHHSALFRDPLTFALLEQRILPELVARAVPEETGELRVWSAGCAAGQEAYSLAILLSELSDGRERAIPFRVFATDRSEAQLAAARRGVFSDAAMGHVTHRRLERWFTRREDAFVVAPELRERIDFSSYDLLDERRSSPPASIFGEFDLVSCCNVLFYYRPEGRQLILDRLARSLAPGGYVVTGETERLFLQGAGFRAVFPHASIFRRTEDR
jgi:chemotaxis methyl-accepting protein methylase